MRWSIIFCLLFSFVDVRANVVIRGKIVDYDGKSVVYYVGTTQGIYGPYSKQVKPEANGTFRIEYKNDYFGTTTVHYKGVMYRFFHDENSRIYFEIKDIGTKGTRRRIPGERIFSLSDTLKQALTVKISGDYEAINRFYNRNQRTSYFTTRLVEGTYYSHLITKAGTPSDAFSLLDSLAKIELKQIEQLPWKVNIENQQADKKDAAIREFLVNEIRAFYSAVFLNAMSLQKKHHVLKKISDPSSEPGIYSWEWEVAIEMLAEDVQNTIKATTASPDYLELMEALSYTLSNYKEYDFPQNPTMSLDDGISRSLFAYDTTLFRDEHSRFAHELNSLHIYLNNPLFYSPVLLHAFYELQSRHPTSMQLEFYKPQVEKIRLALEKAHADFQKGQIINISHHSFRDLLNQFQGKPVLVDVWATWCHPCIDDFRFKKFIQPFIDDGKIHVLYISIDKPQWEDRWRQCIKINELEGNHFRADDAFVRDMWSVIGDVQNAIPRYVLVDKDGNIFRSTAASPGENGELVKQIESLISK